MVDSVNVAMLPGNIRHRPRPGGYHLEVASREVRSMFLSSYIGLAFATVTWSRSMIWIIVYLAAVAVLYLALLWIAVDDKEQPD
jgi:hypothetical protein